MRVDHRELAPLLRGVHVHPFALQSRTNGVPLFMGRDQDDALAVGESGPRKPADRAIEEILVLVELDDVVARTGRRLKPLPLIHLVTSLSGSMITSRQSGLGGKMHLQHRILSAVQLLVAPSMSQDLHRARAS